MDKSKHKLHGHTHDKGVNITQDEFPVQSPTAENTSINTSDFPSLLNVRTDLQNTIDVMGPTTPHFIYTTSSVDADNEESIISSTSIFSSVLQIKNKTKDQGASTFDAYSPQDVSEISTLPDSDLIMTHNSPRDNQTQFENLPQPLYVPTILPQAVLCMNPDCMCAHSVQIPQPVPLQTNTEDGVCNGKAKPMKKQKFSGIFGKITKTHKEPEPAPAELYRINITQPKRDGSPPKRFVFDLMDEAPKREFNTVGTNTKPCYHPSKPPNQIKSQMIAKKSSCAIKDTSSAHDTHYSGIVVTHSSSDTKMQDKTYYEKLENMGKLHAKITDQNTARVDVYYFDHGNAAYYRTTDSPPLIMTELMAEKTENYATRFWAEVFGSVYIAFAFFTSFFLQFVRFIMHSFIRPLTIGLLQLLSDYFFKPFLAVIFNAIIQPPLIFLYNVATSLRDLCDPIAAGIGYFFKEISVICRAFRLVEIKQDRRCSSESQSKCECGLYQKPTKNDQS